MTINEDINLIDFYVKRNDIDNALIIAKMNELKNEKKENKKKLSFFKSEDSKNEHKRLEDNYLVNEIMETDVGHTEGSKRDVVRTVNVHAALRFLTLSKPIHAAAQVYY